MNTNYTMNSSEAYSSNSKKDGVASATWPDPLSAMGHYPYYSYPSVPQGTHLDLGYPSIAGSYIPGSNAADDAAFSLAPTTEMGAFANLPTQVDFTNHVSNRCAGTSAWTYPAVPQNTYLDAGSSIPDFPAAGNAAFPLTPTTEMGTFANLPIQVDFTNQASNQCVGTSTSTYPAVPQNVLDPWSMLGPCMFLSCICYYPSYSPGANSKAHFDVNPAVPQPQLVGDQYWTGVAPLGAYSAAATPDVSANAWD
jgi:hypothetical protein